MKIKFAFFYKHYILNLNLLLGAFERAMRFNLFAKGAKRIFTSIPNAKPSMPNNFLGEPMLAY